LELRLKKKLGSKDYEPMLIADLSTGPPAPDSFKAVYVPLPSKPSG
jgi:hypothetical protein